jgi:iron complex transport system substrate-binding protein
LVVLLCASALVFAGGAQEAGESDALGETPAIEDARGVAFEPLPQARVVTLGAAVTEIVFALDKGDQVVGVDASSTYPAEGLADLPRTGYVRSVPAEGVLSLTPDLVIASEDVGPPEVVEQVEDAGVPVFLVPEDDSFEGAKARVELVGALLGAAMRAEEIIAEIDRDVERANTILSAVPEDERESVMFIYARGVGSLSVSGTGTSAHAIITLAGGRNAVSEYQGYRPLTAEAAVALNPDVLLLFESGLQSIGGMDGLAEIPGIAETSAFEEGRVLSFEGSYLLGFGPRVGQAALELTEALYPEAEADL